MMRQLISKLFATSDEERKRGRDDDDDDEEPSTKRSRDEGPQIPFQGLTALLRHPKNKRIWLKKGGVPALKFDGKQIYGLLKRARAIFYPNYNYETARHIDRAALEGEVTMPFSEDGARKGGKTRALGAFRGTAVDNDLKLWVNNPTAFKRKTKHPPMCVDIITAFTRWEWTGIVAQFPLVAETIGVWTPADMIAVDADGVPVLVEIKTGYKVGTGEGDLSHALTHFSPHQDYLYRYSGMMAGPLSDLPDTPMNQHYLQVGLEMLISLNCYGFRFTKSFVVQAINDIGVIPHPLPKWFTDRESRIWEYFSNHCLLGVGEVPSAARDRARTSKPRFHPTATPRRTFHRRGK